jgi:hypothetical protein
MSIHTVPVAFKFGQKLLVAENNQFLSKKILNVLCTVSWEILAPMDVFTAPPFPLFLSLKICWRGENVITKCLLSNLDTVV